MNSQFSIGFEQSISNNNSLPPVDQMVQQTSTNNALGTLIGYLGAEAATQDIFERLLWPQRFYNDIGLHNSIKMALFLPMGAPLHKAALASLDRIRKNGLFKGREQGHMLGSPFYKDTRIGYSVHSSHELGEPQEELVRNGFWVRAIANVPLPTSVPPTGSRSVETGLRESGIPGQQKIRAINRVSHLRLSIASSIPKSNQIIGNETGSTTLKTYLALVVTESTAIVTGVFVASFWGSWFMLLWFAPLFLKLVSAFLAVPRGPLELLSPPRPPKSPQSLSESLPLSEKMPSTSVTSRKFEIHDPLHGFLIIEGDENLILQFFRHYGHPIRNRFRECAQISIVVAFGCLFPVGLICSILCMSLGVQYVWLAYQIYTTLAMYVYHFAEYHALGTTEQKIAQRFAQLGAKGHKQIVYFGGKEGVILAELEATYHNRVKEGKAHMQTLLFNDVQEFQGHSGRASGSGTSVDSTSSNQSSAGLTSRTTSTSIH